MTRPDTRLSHTPALAILLSAVAMAVPVAMAIFLPEELGSYKAIFWLMALIPTHFFAYYRAWKGVATSMAVAMATLSVTHGALFWAGEDIPELLAIVVVAYLFIALGIGVLAESLHRERTEVEDMAFTDPLTELPNRRHAWEFLQREFAAAQRGRFLALILFDLDGFKEYNDTYGHGAGDEAIKVFADVLATSTRLMNLSARFGGEEFLCVLTGSNLDGAMTYANRVRETFHARAVGEPPLTVSGGVAVYHSGMPTIEDLLAAADEALYTAKRDGRNCIRLHSGPPVGEVPVNDPARSRVR